MDRQLSYSILFHPSAAFFNPETVSAKDGVKQAGMEDSDSTGRFNSKLSFIAGRKNTKLNWEILETTLSKRTHSQG